MSFDFNSFGSVVFNHRAMCERLSVEVCLSLENSIDNGLPLDPMIADEVACAMKDWAIELGATHYTHWFQPMTNITAGKHDSFISLQKDGSVILNFTGKELIKGEPDASSFPSGGLRSTFEARGYTAWDCTSPAFVRDGTLYIPTAFCSYTGEALDTKTPLLRSMAAISEESLKLVRLFGNNTATRVNATVGAEQEYFLIDRERYEARMDLKICGRTLFGARPPKGQEMDDHYFGRIRLRVGQFMQELDGELWKLGVSSKTKHNEAAPAQHELAPIFETVNIACDHNQLTMEMLRIVAKRNGLACLLHEKPFDFINGSGKHNNWSLSTDDGKNLLSPGKTPIERIQFLLVLSAIIQAVDEYADLLRMAAAVPGNDHRLGGHEAPPAIISIFLGESLTELLHQIASGETPVKQASEILHTGVATLPALKKDESDRNRTSPLAFTGNKFEFRMVGSSASIASVNHVLNTIVAKAFRGITARLEAASDFDSEIKSIIADIMEKHGRIIYNGNNYTDEWVQIAKERGLSNLPDCVSAAGAILEQKNIDVLEEFQVLSKVECQSRYYVALENFVNIVVIEANTMLEMTNRQILPAVIAFAGEIAQSYQHLSSAGLANDRIYTLASKLSKCVSDISDAEEALSKAMKQPNNDMTEYAHYCRDTIRPLMNALRCAVDNAEQLVSSDAWPMPTYTDLLHRV